MQRIPESSETATTAAAVVGPSLDELAREGARRMLVAALEAEVADCLADRVVSGPHPALRDAAYEERDGKWHVVAGTPTWAGQGLEACQRIVNRDGLSSSRVECQHEVETTEGSLFKDVTFKHCAPEAVPDLVAATVWVDPAISETDRSDSHGIQVDGLAADGTIYRLYSWEGITSPLDALRRAILAALAHGSRTVGVETDQGGDTWWSVYEQACRSLVEDRSVEAGTKFPGFLDEKAGRGYGPKVERASRQLADYERGRIVHVLDEQRSYAVLEKALRRFPVRAPHDLTDASFWSWNDLRSRNLVTVPLARPVVHGPVPPDLQDRWEAEQEWREQMRAKRRAVPPAWPVRRWR
jgi:hypothetical protein